MQLNCSTNVVVSASFINRYNLCKLNYFIAFNIFINIHINQMKLSISIIKIVLIKSMEKKPDVMNRIWNQILLHGRRKNIVVIGIGFSAINILFSINSIVNEDICFELTEFIIRIYYLSIDKKYCSEPRLINLLRIFFFRYFCLRPFGISCKSLYDNIHTQCATRLIYLIID